MYGTQHFKPLSLVMKLGRFFPLCLSRFSMSLQQTCDTFYSEGEKFPFKTVKYDIMKTTQPPESAETPAATSPIWLTAGNSHSPIIKQDRTPQ